MDKPLSEYWVRKSRGGQPASRCKPCSVEANREWRKINPDYEKERYQREKVETRERHLIRKYGVNLADYKAMLADQGGVCAICGRPENGEHYSVLHVDHCHTTGRVRGLLCRGCNHMLGHIKDDSGVFLKAVEYLSPKQSEGQS